MAVKNREHSISKDIPSILNIMPFKETRIGLHNNFINEDINPVRNYLSIKRVSRSLAEA